MSEPVARSDIGDRINREDLEVGDTVVFEWSPYEWWSDHHDVSGLIVVTVTRAPSQDIAGDAILGVDGAAMTLRDYGEGRRYVSGPAAFNPEVPDRTDVGMGGRYYALDHGDRESTANAEREREQTEGDA